MRNSLNSWPPVASHMACLLLGFAIPHLEVLDFRNDVLPLDAVYISRPHPPENAQPLVLIKRDGETPCKWSSTVWRTYQAGPTFLVGAPLDALQSLPQTLSRLADQDVRFAPASQAQTYSICDLQPSVTYEQR